MDISKKAQREGKAQAQANGSTSQPTLATAPQTLSDAEMATVAGGSARYVSDRTVKENFVAVNAQEILQKVVSLPISTWSYKQAQAGVEATAPQALSDAEMATVAGGSVRFFSDCNIKENFVAVNAQEVLEKVVALPITTWSYKQSQEGVEATAPQALSDAEMATVAGGSLRYFSDRNVKEQFSDVDAQAVLDRVAALPITTWNYKDNGSRHIGPMAQDFAAAFTVGDSDRFINAVDANGVALAAIQGLYQLLQEKDAQISKLHTDLNALKQLIAPQSAAVSG